MSELLYKVGEQVVQYNGRVVTVFGVNGLELYTVKDDYGKVWFVGINTIDHEATANFNQPKTPKEMLEDGFIGCQENVEYSEIYFIPSKQIFLTKANSIGSLSFFNDNLEHMNGDFLNIIRLYNREYQLVWQRTEKSPQQIEIERIESTIRDCADRLSKLKGEI